MQNEKAVEALVASLSELVSIIGGAGPSTGDPARFTVLLDTPTVLAFIDPMRRAEAAPSGEGERGRNEHA